LVLEERALVISQIVLVYGWVVPDLGLECSLGNLVVVATLDQSLHELVGVLLASIDGSRTDMQLRVCVDVNAAGAIDVADGGAEVLGGVELNFATATAVLHVLLLEEDGSCVLLFDPPVEDAHFVLHDVGDHAVLGLEEDCFRLLPVVQVGCVLVGPDILPDGTCLGKSLLFIYKAEDFPGFRKINYGHELCFACVSAVVPLLDDESGVLDFGVQLFSPNRALESSHHVTYFAQVVVRDSLPDPLELILDRA